MWKKRMLCLVLVLCAALLTACQQEEKEVYSNEAPKPTEVVTQQPFAVPNAGQAQNVPSGSSIEDDIESGAYDPASEEDGQDEEIIMTETPAPTTPPFMTSEYAGATPVLIDPIDKPTPTPLPKLTFSYSTYEASTLHLSFEGPTGWIPDETAPDTFTLTNPDTSMDYAAQVTIRAVPLNKQYSKNELTKEVKGAMDTLRSDMGFSKFDPSKTASRDFINGKGVYMSFTGTLKEGGVKIAGRIMVNCVNKTLYILTCTYPGGLADTFAEGVYNKVRSTMKVTK